MNNELKKKKERKGRCEAKAKSRSTCLRAPELFLVIQVREHMSEAFVKAPASVAQQLFLPLPCTCPFILEVALEQRKDDPEY